MDRKEKKKVLFLLYCFDLFGSPMSCKIFWAIYLILIKLAFISKT